MMKVEDREMLSPREVARRLGVSRRTVRRWVAAGVLPAYRVGGVIRIHPGELARFLERSRTGPMEVRDGGGALAGAATDTECAG